MDVFFLSCFNLHCVIYGYLKKNTNFKQKHKKNTAYEIHNAMLKNTRNNHKKVTKLIVQKKRKFPIMMVQERNGEKIYVCRKNLSKMESLSRKGNETFFCVLLFEEWKRFRNLLLLKHCVCKKNLISLHVSLF